MFVVAWTNRCISLKIIHLRELGQSKKRSFFQCLWQSRGIYNNESMFFWNLRLLPPFVFFESRCGIPRSYAIRILLLLLFPVNLVRGRGRRIANRKQRIDFIYSCASLLSSSSYFRISNFRRKSSLASSLVPFPVLL